MTVARGWRYGSINGGNRRQCVAPADESDTDGDPDEVVRPLVTSAELDLQGAEAGDDRPGSPVTAVAGCLSRGIAVKLSAVAR